MPGLFWIAFALFSLTMVKAIISKRDENANCYENLGCFPPSDDYSDSLFPNLKMIPHHPKIINTRFYLYQRDNVMEPQQLSATKEISIRNSTFNAKLQTKFIIHGFLDNKLYGDWEDELKNQILLRENYNVIVVDWSEGNYAPYNQAVANTRVVGAEVTFLIRKLIEVFSLKPNDVHLIGHSLGAHISGSVGKRIMGIGRITGLDPAGILFENSKVTVRLDKEDARFVDVIHTNAGTSTEFCLGIVKAIGHLDFYPNGGKRQPGCTINKTLLKLITKGIIGGFRELVACEHERAIKLFINSINHHQCQFISTSCSSWNDFQGANCNNSCRNGHSENCAIMGWRADEYLPYISKESKKMYVKTGPTSPFCLNDFKVSVKIHPTLVKNAHTGGLEVELISRHSKKKITLDKKVTLIPDHGYVYRLKYSIRPEEIERINLIWYSSSSSLIWDETKSIAVEYILIEYLVFIPNELQPLRKEIKFCNETYTIIKSKEPATFNNDDSC